jgi:hypothetical protein
MLLRVAIQKEMRADSAQSSIVLETDSSVRPSKNSAAIALDNEPAIIAAQLLTALTVPAICGICCNAPCVTPGAIVPTPKVVATNIETAIGIGVQPITAMRRELPMPL